jgi:hypothetical protein
MTRRSQDVQYLDGFVKALWPAAVDLFGAEFTHAAVEGFNGGDEPPEEPEQPADPIPAPPSPSPMPDPPSPEPVPPVDPTPPDGPGDPGPVLHGSPTGATVHPQPRHSSGVPDFDLDAGKKALTALKRLFRDMGQMLAEVVVRPRMVETSTRMDLDLQPAVSVTGTEQITVHFPARRGFPPAGHHTFRTRIRLFGSVVGGITGSRFRVELRIPLAITFSRDVEPDIDDRRITVHTNRRGKVLNKLHAWRDEVERELGDADLRTELGFLTSARYDPDAVGVVPPPEPVLDDRPALDDAVNVVFVPDGFDPGELHRFEDLVATTVERLYGHVDDHVNEPFRSFKTALNLWTLIPEQTKDGDHVVASHQPDPKRAPKVALGNLARLAAVGRAAEGALTGPTILVFAANHEAARFGSRTPRAMAMGKVILHPTRGDSPEDVSRWADTLLHELGHTPLGDLADEYVERGREHVRYRGQDRQVANVEASWLVRNWHRGIRPGRLAHARREVVFARWRQWMENPDQLPPWDRHPITGVEGGGLFGRWSWRPAEDCAMNSTSELSAPFCAVCREALARGFRELLPRGRFLFEVTDASGQARLLQLEPEGSAPTMTGHLRVATAGTGVVRVALVAGTLPEPWEVDTSFHGDGELEHRRDSRPRTGGPDTRYAWSFPASVGDRLTIRIGSGTPFTPWDETPELTVELRCEADPAEVRPPAAPDGLAARQVGKSPGGTPQQAMLSATTEDPNGQDVRVEFEVVRSGHDFRGSVSERTGWLSPPEGGGRVTGEVSHRALDGRYQFRARARNRSGRSSRWSESTAFELAFPRPGNGHAGGDGSGTGGIGDGGGTGGRPGTGGGLPPHIP